MKAKRAKERARLKKLQLQQQQQQQQSENVGSSDPPSLHSRTQSDPTTDDGDSYSNPVDSLRQKGDYPRRQQNQHNRHDRHEYYHQRESSDTSFNSRGEPYGEENYSNPIDMIRKEGSGATKKQPMPPPHRRDDEIYVLPTGGSGQQQHTDYHGPTRPNQLELRGPLNRPAPPRAHVPEGIENIAAYIDPTYPSSGSTTSGTPGNGVSPGNHPDTSEYSDQSSSPVPPYMPIQGQRRNTSLENKKKKTKDKCTHQ